MYYFSKVIELSFNKAIEKVISELAKEGFGILTRINVNEKFKEKLDIDFKKYEILGACNPAYAYKALSVEDKIGTMLPCNIIVQELSENKIEVAAINPIESMKAVDNAKLIDIAKEITLKLENVIKAL